MRCFRTFSLIRNARVKLPKKTLTYSNHRFQSRSVTTNPSQLTLTAHMGAVPKPKAVLRGDRAKLSREFGCAGEDAFFLYHCRKTRQVSVGVADGVGNWGSGRTDAAHFAQTLMQSGLDFVKDNPQGEDDGSSLPIVLEYCVGMTRDSVGASTICLAHVDLDSSLLSCVNLGDSGLAIFRPNISKKSYELCLRTEPQEQEFGVPKQLSSSSRSNSPEDADVISDIGIEKGDVILLGTDGLWDNLFMHEIEDVMSVLIRMKDDERIDFVRRGDMTNRMIYEALSRSRDPYVDTPFSEHMTDVVGMIYHGGKPDDITCGILYIH